MKAVIDDKTALVAMSPLDVAIYLRAHGWSFEGTSDAFMRYARGKNGARLELEVPRSARFRDFQLRMAEVLAGLAREEQRPQIEILEEIRATSADVVRFRLAGADLQGGTIPLEDGAMLVERARDAMLASACATIQPRATFGHRAPDDASDFLKRIRLGSPERGSFIVKLLSPVAPELSSAEAGSLFPEMLPPPFERRAVETLMKASEAAVRAAVEAGPTGGLAPFEAAVARGASANLCESLSSVLNAGSYAELELSVGWALNRPPPTGIPTRVRISADTAKLLASAAQGLRARAPRDDFELEGYVVALENEDVGQAPGTAVIAAVVDQRVGSRRVRVSLSPDAYKIAHQAHMSQARVGCQGRLVKSGRQYEVQEPRNFAILPED